MKNYKIYPKVKMGRNCKIGDYTVIGLPPRGKREGKLETIIGDNALIRSHTVIYAGNVIGNNLQTGHQVMIRESNRIGDKVSIGTSIMLNSKSEALNPKQIRISNDRNPKLFCPTIRQRRMDGLNFEFRYCLGFRY